MKKLLLAALGALLALPSMAQEEDVTHYIQNAGFDEDVTWQANGATKDIVSRDHELSNRSYAYVAADSSVYAYGRGTRKDGYSPAWNGFFGQIAGWTAGDKSYTGKSYYPYGTDSPEWVYFGSVPYDLGETAIPIADDGTTFLVKPEKPAADSGDDNKAFLYLRAGWGGAATYKQVVKLPCAQYRLEYWAINTNPSATKGSNLSRVVCRKDTWKDETGFTDTEWTLHTIEFTPTAEFTMEFGFKSEGGSGGNPFLCIDAIKLYKIGEADPMQILQSDLSDTEDEIYDVATQASMAGFNSLYFQIDEYIDDLEDAIDDAETQEELQAVLNQANAMLNKFKEAAAVMADINAMIEKIDNLLATTNYPGKDALQQAWDELNEMKKGDDPEIDYATLMLTAVDKAKEAIKTYQLSQKENASEENPADFTFLIQHPWFINDDAEPVWSEDEQTWVFPKRYTYNEETGEETDNYKEGSASSPDLNSEGWYIAGASGGDQRLNWQRGRSCWNAWNNNFTTTLAVAQDFTDLPNGYYTVSADLITQTGYAIGTQHVYAQTTAGKNVSEATLTIEGWDNSEWENVAMTAAEKVLVVDGKLTIGAQGTGNGDAAAGWFCATNFRLNYLGQASDEVIAAALKESFDARIAEAKELAAAMHFKADAKALNDSIAKYQVAADKDAYIEALIAMQAALDEANKSEAKYYDYLPSQETIDESEDPDALISSKTLIWVQKLLNDEDVIDHEPFTQYTKPIAQFALDYVNAYIVCDTATYKQFDATVDLLKNYVNTYIPAYNEAFEMTYASSEKGKAALESLMARQKAALIAEMKDKETVDAYVKELKNMITAIEKQNIYDDPNATDYTAFIINPNAEATDGWTFEMGNGDGNGEKSGQWMDDSSTRYFDTYNGGGLKNFKFSQLITGLPNGTYNLGVYTRTPNEGAYVFYALQSDTTFVEIPLDYYQTYTEAGEDTTVVASDQHGPIWEEAKAKVESGDYTEWDLAVYNANYDNDMGEGRGRGWKHQQMNGIKVDNHELLIGSMTGTEESQTPKVFSGAWYSVGGWTLTLAEMGDNSGWAGPIESGITTLVVNNAMADGIYTLSGTKVSKLQRGVNIIITNGNARKVMVK